MDHDVALTAVSFTADSNIEGALLAAIEDFASNILVMADLNDANVAQDFAFFKLAVEHLVHR